MAWGLKSVRNRRDDALSRIGWDRLESLLAEHYRQEGYRVEHVGTGGSGRRRRFDGGIDLKLRKDDAYVLVQSKHWNVYQVTHNAVHELLGLMVNEGATGAILVTSGEFTRAAIEAATRHGHVQLVDGDGLRAMLGPVPEIGAAGTMSARASDFISAVSESPNARRIGRAVNERLVSEVEGLVRGGRRSGYARKAVVVSAWLVAAKIVGALLLFWLMTHMIGNALRAITAPRVPAVREMPSQQVRIQAASNPQPAAVRDLGAVAGGAVRRQSYRQQTREEIRESQRRADEAMKVIEATTPEM